MSLVKVSISSDDKDKIKALCEEMVKERDVADKYPKPIVEEPPLWKFWERAKVTWADKPDLKWHIIENYPPSHLGLLSFPAHSKVYAKEEVGAAFELYRLSRSDGDLFLSPGLSQFLQEEILK